MNRHRIKRILGFVLWAVALVGFLPPALVNTEGTDQGTAFLLFNIMVALLVIGYLLIDSAKRALQREEYERGHA